MKINHKILSLPPYISTSWKNVLTLHLEPRDDEHCLLIGLVNGSTIEVPDLDNSILQAIFMAHEKYLESETAPKPPSSPVQSGGQTVIGIPLNFGIEGIEQIGSMMQHNPESANSPNLPPEILEKVSTLVKMIGLDGNGSTLPKAEPHCNCMHCQILRAMHADDPLPADENSEEEVSENDLKFRDWEIKEVADKLFEVTNPLYPDEHYNVHLGTPIGCTCGEKNCEHVRAVLNS